MRFWQKKVKPHALLFFILIKSKTYAIFIACNELFLIILTIKNLKIII